MIIVGNERFDSHAAKDLAAAFFGATEQRSVKNMARERERLKRQRSSDGLVAGRKTKSADGCGSKIQRVHAGLVEIVDCLAAEEFTTDLMMRTGFFFKEDNAAACGGQADGGHGAGGSAADDEMVDVSRLSVATRDRHGLLLRLTQRRAGKKGSMETSRRSRPASEHIRRQSSGMKERAMETGPSCWTKRWRPASLVKIRRR